MEIGEVTSDNSDQPLSLTVNASLFARWQQAMCMASTYFVSLRAAMCYCRVFRAVSSIDGCIVCGNRYVLSPHFSRRVLYRWLYNLWKSVKCAIIRSFLLAYSLGRFARHTLANML